MKRSRSQRGSVTGFVVALMLAVIVFAGLVIDGARVVAGHVSAADHAENAARAGAQEIVEIRGGNFVIDVSRATATATSYLSAHGVAGTVNATPTQVSVTVTSTISTTLLALVGVSSTSVSATRTSVPVTH